MNRIPATSSVTSDFQFPNNSERDVPHRVAVLGSPVAHSLSPVLHNAGYGARGLNDWHYDRIEVGKGQLADFVEQADDSYRGFSVTMPGKFEALQLADHVSGRANMIGTANTLVRRDDGWFADNTDGDGVLGALGELFPNECGSLSHVVVLGSGGTSRPVLWALGTLGVREVTIVNRSDRSSEWAPLAESMGLEWNIATWEDSLEDCDAIISTVPAGAVAGHERRLAHAPILDVIYDPWPTPLTIQAASNGHRSVGGHVMLAHQAFGQFRLFTGLPAPKEEMWAALDRELNSRKLYSQKP